MADPAGDELAVVLLRSLPADAAESVLGRLSEPDAAKIRARLAAPADPPSGEEVDGALAAFFDMLRIAGRHPIASPPAAPPPPAGPLDELKSLPPDRLARALEGESAVAVALVLSTLEPTAAGQVMRRLAPELRAEVAVRLSRSQARNPALLDRLARAVAEKGRRLADAPAVPTSDERVTHLADVIRALPRPDRNPVLQKLDIADSNLAAAVREKLYRIEDLMRIPDRQLQTLLTELDVKKLALALKDADPRVRAKVTANMSSRAKTVLGEESELLGDVPSSSVREARNEVLAIVRRLEEEGRVTIEE